VYRSPLGRTAETAALVAPGSSPVVLPGLTEIDYGDWEGLSPAEITQRDHARFEAWQRDPTHLGPPGGESAAQVAARAVEAIEEIEARHADQEDPHVLVVSHKATLRILAARLMGAPVASYRRRWSQDECALNLVELRPGKEPFLRLWNDTSHLGRDPAAATRGGH
jgi:broad specificity phosphatase PhoE